MSKIEDKAVDIMDKAMVGAEKLSEKLAELAQQYGPDVVDAGLAVARVAAAQDLVYGVLWAGVTVLLVWATYQGYLKIKKEDMWEASPLLALTAVPACLTGIGSGMDLFNIWNWVGVIEPKLWIAHRILEKAL